MYKYILLTCCSIFIGCDKLRFGDYGIEIQIQNHHTQNIYYYIAGLKAPNQYPDTNLPIDRPVLDNIPPGTQEDYFLRARKSKNYIDDLPADILSIFIFSDNVYENLDWLEIRRNYLILERYDLSYEDLEQNDFIVTYP